MEGDVDIWRYAILELHARSNDDDDDVCLSSLMGPVTLTFDRLTLKLGVQVAPKVGTFLPNSDTLGLWVLELFAMYATDGQTSGRTDGQKQCLLLFTYGGGGIRRQYTSNTVKR